MFANTEYFRESAKYFEQHGTYTKALKGTKDWSDFWRTEFNRCVDGYSVAGTRITGKHYHYLNYGYMPINTIFDDNSNYAERENGFPRFWDGDYEFFHIHDIAERGISQEEYNKLELHTNVLDLDGGKHLLWLKGRGKGFSHKVSSVQTHTYHFDRNKKLFMTAQNFDKDIIGSDGLFNKTKSKIYFQTEHCAWGQSTLTDNVTQIQGGFLVAKDGKKFVPTGRLNDISGLRRRTPTDSAIFRGIRGKYFDIEEGGEFKNLLKTLEVTNRSTSEGKYSFGMIRLWGTGGAEDESFEELFTLFYNPSPYKFIAVTNHYDREEDEYYNRPCACFFSTTWNLLGHYDKDGNSNLLTAKAELEEDMASLSTSNNKDSDALAIARRLAENAIYPRDTQLRNYGNGFPIDELKDHLMKLDVANLNLKHGQIVTASDGHVVFNKDKNVTPLSSYPIQKDKYHNLDGCTTILEPPINGVPYLVVHDGYHNDEAETTTTSVGSTYVFKLQNIRSFSYINAPVAWYNGRPDNIDAVNETTIGLAKMYNNAKIAAERASVHLLSYAKKNMYSHMILDDLDIGLTHTIGKKAKKKVLRKGLTLDDVKKDLALKRAKTFLMKNIFIDDDKIVRLYELYKDRGIIEEFIKFRRGKNADRVSVFIIFIIYVIQIGEALSQVEDEDEDEDLKEFLTSAI